MYVGRMVLVSVPYGDIFYFYFNLKLIYHRKKDDCFRPLWGSFLFLWTLLEMNLVQIIVSVPYGDLFYFYGHC